MEPEEGGDPVWKGARSVLTKKKETGTATRFGTIRFKYKHDAERAIQSLNGAMVQQSLLFMNRARYKLQDDRTSCRDRSAWRPKVNVHNKTAAQQVGKQIWRVKETKQDDGQGSSNRSGPAVFQSTEEDGKRMECLAVATLREVYTIEVIQYFLYANGLGMIKSGDDGHIERGDGFSAAKISDG